MAATEVVDRLLEYVQTVYTSVEEEQYYFFDKHLEEEKTDYEKWENAFRHSAIAPLGLKKEEYVFRDIGRMDMELVSEEEDEEEEEGEADDYYEDDDMLEDLSSHLSSQ